MVGGDIVLVGHAGEPLIILIPLLIKNIISLDFFFAVSFIQGYYFNGAKNRIKLFFFCYRVDINISS